METFLYVYLSVDRPGCHKWSAPLSTGENCLPNHVFFGKLWHLLPSNVFWDIKLMMSSEKPESRKLPEVCFHVCLVIHNKTMRFCQHMGVELPCTWFSHRILPFIACSLSRFFAFCTKVLLNCSVFATSLTEMFEFLLKAWTTRLWSFLLFGDPFWPLFFSRSTVKRSLYRFKTRDIVDCTIPSFLPMARWERSGFSRYVRKIILRCCCSSDSSSWFLGSFYRCFHR